MPDAVFEGTGMSVSYGGVAAVRDLDLRVGRGEIVGLIGPNGAGKTSFIDGVSGFARMSGSYRLLGTDLAPLSAHRRNRLGLSRTWQSVALFADLTIRENVTVAAAHTRGRGRGASAAMHERVTETLRRAGAEPFAERLPGELSHGQRVLAGVARALASQPALMLMDEPGAGLDDAEGRELAAFIRGVAADGIAVLLVDHDMALVLEVCDRIAVLDFGRLIATGTPGEIATDPAVVAAYLGTSAGGSAVRA